MTPAEELRDAIKVLCCDHRFDAAWQPEEQPPSELGCQRCGVALRRLDVLAAEAVATFTKLLEALADDMEAYEYGVVEGSASKAVHPVSPLGVGLSPSRADWTAALAVARAITGGGA